MSESNSTERPSAKKENAPAGPTSMFRILKNLFGFSAILLSWWTALITILLGQSIVILYYADGYRPETFTIDKLVFIKGQFYPDRKTHDTYWAEGSVAGQKEKFDLGGYVEGVIQNQEELDSLFKIGQVLPVVYNPDVPEKHGIRILYPEKNFRETWRLRRDKIFRTGYLPLIFTLGLCFICGILAKKTKSAVGFIFGSLFFVIFAWIFILLKRFA